MHALGRAVAAALPLALAGEPQRAWAESTFPEMVIRKGDSAHEWPFSVDQGELTCIDMFGPRHVFFSEILSEEEQGTFGNMKLPRMVAVSTNPMAVLASFEDRDLYLPWGSFETLIARLAPYERMGAALCERRLPEQKN